MSTSELSQLTSQELSSKTGPHTTEKQLEGDSEMNWIKTTGIKEREKQERE